MKTEIFDFLHEDAAFIREKVFREEQGFVNEFDDKDADAIHLVMYFDDGSPAAVCRILNGDTAGCFILGRFAVLKEYRGRHLGALLITEAEKEIKRRCGTNVMLHAQTRAMEFYRKSGYTPYGEIEDDEGCPHIKMKKSLLP